MAAKIDVSECSESMVADMKVALEAKNVRIVSDEKPPTRWLVIEPADTSVAVDPEEVARIATGLGGKLM